jgi:Site-specific recombinase XerD
MMIKNYQYQSCLASHIEALILQKRLEGFRYDTEEYHLKRFDAFCMEQSLSQPLITRDLVMAWRDIRDTEGKANCSRRVTAIRQLALYMQSQGMEAYIPTHFYKKSHYVAHVLSDEEILEFFKTVDNYHPELNAVVFMRLSMEYRILFRIIYCCGLRISEARKLKITDVNLSNGSIRIVQSKGRKDRIVYLAPDLLELCIEYRNLLDSVYHTTSVWFFPARNPDIEFSVCTIDWKFRQFWAKTPYARNCDRSPTVHSLRHSFVVKRMNLWMEGGIALNSMMPYLSKYLGHCSPDDTFYYYHQIDAAFKIIRSKDILSSKIIPEASTYEE